jgi:LacI family transcriptional regulator
MDEQITIKDIGKLLNISPSTVSRALNGNRQISQKTQELVRATAERLNYQPNKAALSLAKTRTKTIGVIVPNLGYYFFSRALQGIEDEATKRGFTIIACQSLEIQEKEVKNTVDMLRSGVDGVIVSLAQHSNNVQHFEKLQNHNIPIVLFDRVSDELKNTSKVTVDNVAGAFGAVEHLIKQGCKRIAFLTGPEKLVISNRRKDGYKMALAKYKIPYDPALIVHCEFDHDKAVEATNKLLKLSNPPDGIFGMSDRFAVAAMVAVKQKKLNIPNDVAIIGFNNEPISAFLTPTLTTIDQPIYEIGQTAARLLIDQIEQGPSFIPKNKLFITKLIKRESSKREKK